MSLVSNPTRPIHARPLWQTVQRLERPQTKVLTAVKKRRAQICGQIQRFIKIPTELRRQTRTSTTHTKQAQRV
jgi:hypothetical protein